MKPILVLGGGGHAKVIIDTLVSAGVTMIGFLDQNPAIRNVLGIDQLGPADPHHFDRYRSGEVVLANGFGGIGKDHLRRDMFCSWKERGFSFMTVIHQTAIISSNVSLNEGVQIMAGAVIQPGSLIGENALINTRAVVDHDCEVGNHVHIATGAMLSGGVQVGEGTHVGAGAAVIQGIRIGKNSVVGAGSVVVRNVPDNCRVMGVPAHHNCKMIG